MVTGRGPWICERKLSAMDDADAVVVTATVAAVVVAAESATEATTASPLVGGSSLVCEYRTPKLIWKSPKPGVPETDPPEEETGSDTIIHRSLTLPKQCTAFVALATKQRNAVSRLFYNDHRERALSAHA